MTSPVQVGVDGPPGHIELDGEVYQITTWLPLLTVLPYRPDWHVSLLLDVLHHDDADALLDRLADDTDPLTPTALHPVADHVVRAATGWPWYAAARLLGVAGERWPEVEGALTLRGIDLRSLVDTAPGRAVNLLYAAFIEDADERQRARIDAELHAPPPGAVAGPPPAWAIEDDARAFLAAAGNGTRL